MIQNLSQPCMSFDSLLNWTWKPPNDLNISSVNAKFEIIAFLKSVMMPKIE